MADDPLQFGNWLLGVVERGAEPLAVLSVIVNVYLWRALRFAETKLIQAAEEEARQLRSELDRTRNADNAALRETASMIRMLSDRMQQPPVAPLSKRGNRGPPEL